MKKFALVLNIAGVCLLGVGTSHTALAQDLTNEAKRNAPVTVNVENATLYSVLKTLFDQVKADFTIEADLKNLPVTAHLNQPFRIALETVLKATGQPITSTNENGVYRITVIKEDTAPIVSDPVEDSPLPPKPKPLMKVLHVRNGSGLEIAAILGMKFVPWTTGFFPPYIGMNPFAPVSVGGGGGANNGLGNTPGGAGNTGGVGSGFLNGYSGGFVLPGMGVGFFGNSLGQGSFGGSGGTNGGQ